MKKCVKKNRGTSSLIGEGGRRSFYRILLFLVVVLVGLWFVESVDATTYYVKWDATGAANGTSWDDAFTTITAAHSAASTGDVINVSGGASGHTYDENIDITKGVTIQSSTEAGHSGTVTWEGQKKIHNTVGTITIRNMDFTTNADSEHPLYFYDDSNSLFEDIYLHDVRTVNKYIVVYGGTATFNRCRFEDQYQTSYDASRGFWTSTNPSDFTFNNCIFGYGGGYIIITVGNSNWTFNNNIFVMPNTRTQTGFAVAVGSDSTITVTFNNAVFLGNYPVSSGASSTGVTCNNCYWHQTMGGGGSEITTFDSANVATVNNDINHTLPYFTNVQDSTMGEFLIRMDDKGAEDNARTAAEILNPEVVVNFYTNGHSHFTSGWPQPTQQWVEDLRYLVNNGNEVGGHGSTHSDNADMDAVDISATGTTPRINISGTRSGDSTTWNTTLTVTVNGVSKTFNLTNASYDTIGELVSALNGYSIGDGTITASKTNSNLGTEMLSAVLANATDLDISSQRTLTMNETAYIRFEIRENIEDIEAYIRTGSGRNGQNPSGAGAAEAGSTAETYTVRTFVTAYGRGSTAVLAELQNDSDIWGASKATGGTNGGDIYRFGNSNFNLYNFPYDQGPTNNRIFARVAGTAVSSFVDMPLWHGTPTYDDGLGGGATTAKLKALCQHFGKCNRTFSDVLNNIRSSGDWNVSEPDATFNGTDTDYLYKGNFTLAYNSPLIDAGTNTNLTTDYLGNPIYGIPDIGAYEYQPPYNISADSINLSVSKNIRIYGDGKFRYINSSTSTENANLSVEPIRGFNSSNYSSWMDINITTWTSSLMNWTESSDTIGSSYTTQIICGLTSGDQYDTYYTKSGTRTLIARYIVDSSGCVIFNYTEGYSTVTFDMTKYVAPTTTPDTTQSGGGVPTYYPTESNLQEGYLKQLYTNWKLKFKLNGEDHQLKLDSFNANNKTATITISSEPQTKTLSVGEEWEVNLDNDTFHDLLVRLDNVTFNRANIFIQEINESVSGEGEDVIGGDTIHSEEIIEDEATETNWGLIFGGIFIVLALIVWAFLIGKKHLKKK